MLGQHERPERLVRSAVRQFHDRIHVHFISHASVCVCVCVGSTYQHNALSCIQFIAHTCTHTRSACMHAENAARRLRKWGLDDNNYTLSSNSGSGIGGEHTRNTTDSSVFTHAMCVCVCRCVDYGAVISSAMPNMPVNVRQCDATTTTTTTERPSDVARQVIEMGCLAAASSSTVVRASGCDADRHRQNADRTE